MKAEYRKDSAYPDNPFIESLPGRLSAEELFVRLESRIEVKKEERLFSAEERMNLVSRLFQTYIPINGTAVIYGLLYQSILSSYTGKENVISPSVKAYSTQAQSFSVLGVPGAGKSSAIERILSLFPQVIEHTHYHGKVIFCKQIIYIKIQCPGDCSVKAACLSILMEIDKAVGTSYGGTAMKKGSMTLDGMIAQISQLCFTYHIGVIIVDEVQNLIRINRQGEISKRLVNFFVHLMNETGVGIVLVGTPQAQKLFDSEPHLARRTRGIWLQALTYGAEFDRMFYALWEQQYLRHFQLPSPKLKRMYFEISGGIPALLSQALFFSQQYAILSGNEVLDEDTVRTTAALYHLRKPDSMRNVKDPIIEIAMPEEKESPKVVDQNHVQEISKEPVRGKGRPKKEHGENDIIALYKSCNKEEWIQEFEKRGWIEYV